LQWKANTKVPNCDHPSKCHSDAFNHTRMSEPSQFWCLH
jgi:hypothetical protein